MTGLLSYIQMAWALQTPFAARLWKLAGLARTSPGKLSWNELHALRDLLLDRWPALAGTRQSAALCDNTLSHRAGLELGF